MLGMSFQESPNRVGSQSGSRYCEAIFSEHLQTTLGTKFERAGLYDTKGRAGKPTNIDVSRGMWNCHHLSLFWLRLEVQIEVMWKSWKKNQLQMSLPTIQKQYRWVPAHLTITKISVRSPNLQARFPSLVSTSISLGLRPCGCEQSA